MARTNLRVFKQLEHLCKNDGFLNPQRLIADARAVAVDNTPRNELEGQVIVAFDVPCGQRIGIDEDGPHIVGPVVFYEYGDAEDIAEEYGVPSDCVRGVEEYRDGQWQRL